MKMKMILICVLLVVSGIIYCLRIERLILSKVEVSVDIPVLSMEEKVIFSRVSSDLVSRINHPNGLFCESIKVTGSGFEIGVGYFDYNYNVSYKDQKIQRVRILSNPSRPRVFFYDLDYVFVSN